VIDHLVINANIEWPYSVTDIFTGRVPEIHASDWLLASISWCAAPQHQNGMDCWRRLTEAILVKKHGEQHGAMTSHTWCNYKAYRV